MIERGGARPAVVTSLVMFVVIAAGCGRFAIARESPSGLVGISPRVQLVSTITTRPQSPLARFTGWVILSTDVPGYLWGPINRPSVTEYATYSWVFVTLNGEVVVSTQNTYLTPESVPALPDQ